MFLTIKETDFSVGFRVDWMNLSVTSKALILYLCYSDILCELKINLLSNMMKISLSWMNGKDRKFYFYLFNGALSVVTQTIQRRMK
jgi:hypothetical protein